MREAGRVSLADRERYRAREKGLRRRMLRPVDSNSYKFLRYEKTLFFGSLQVLMLAQYLAGSEICRTTHSFDCCAMSEEAYASMWPRVYGLRIHTRRSRTLLRVTRPVVLIHGLGVSADYMLPTLIRLAPVLTSGHPSSRDSERVTNLRTFSTSTSWPISSPNGSE